MSDSVRTHRRQPTRLPRPWDSPGKNTGVGCHCLLQCMKVKSESKVDQSCLTISDLMDCSPPGSSIHGIFQARVLEWGAIAFSGLFLVGEKKMHHPSFCLIPAVLTFLVLLKCSPSVYTWPSISTYQFFSLDFCFASWHLLPDIVFYVCLL